jgi:hypothetical protein
MSTATTTSHDTGQHTTTNWATTQPSNAPTTQLERSAAQRLRTTMAAVKLSFTWLGVRWLLSLSPSHCQHVVSDPAEFLEYPFDHCLVTGKQFVRASSVKVAEGRLVQGSRFHNPPGGQLVNDHLDKPHLLGCQAPVG